MTDQIDGKTVERVRRMIQVHEYQPLHLRLQISDMLRALLSERDALKAQVEALHRERTNMIATHRDSIKRLTGERNAALAREGAALSRAISIVLEECGKDREVRLGDRIVKRLEIHTDAAAAMERREDEVREECAMVLEHHHTDEADSILCRIWQEGIRALKRSGKE